MLTMTIDLDFTNTIAIGFGIAALVAFFIFSKVR
jgi:hypothetical protein